MKKLLLILSFSVFFLQLTAQPADSLGASLEEVTVTASRSERKLGNVIVPVKIISGEQIRLSGARRLQDVLQEQTGLFLSNSTGSGGVVRGGSLQTGIQVQGLSPDYVLILIDGEPLTGRNSGVLDLNRLSVGNISKIEIVKGPSSSLYGSEAMGGVINIITRDAAEKITGGGIRYGRFGTSDINLEGAAGNSQAAYSVFANRYATRGYDLNPAAFGQTVDPFSTITAQFKARFRFSEATRFNLSARVYDEAQPTTYLSGNTLLSGQSHIREYNFNPTLLHRFNPRFNAILRFYGTQYEALDRRVEKQSGALNYNDEFRQRLLKTELQTNYTFHTNHTLTTGAGYQSEWLNTNRYAGIRTNHIGYLFAQEEWRAGKKWLLIGGLRFDANSAYRSNLSPKLALQYAANSRLKINASFGAGFKAPDNRQLYLNFTNNVAGGYTIYGANEITSAELNNQLSSGILKTVLPNAGRLNLLKPETSRGYNLGATLQVNPRLSANINLFQNDISNLILIDIIAFKANNEPVYSYFNVNSAFTRGLETEWTFTPNSSLQITGGYQLLYTADKTELKRVKAGEVYGRDEASGYPYIINRGDYAGLANRSRSMANLKLFYRPNPHGFSGSARLAWRSRWGTYDRDGNALINRSDEYAPGFALLNLTLGKDWKNGIRLQAGIDNLLNYTDPENLPNQPGRNWFLQMAYQLNRKNKS